MVEPSAGLSIIGALEFVTTLPEPTIMVPVVPAVRFKLPVTELATLSASSVSVAILSSVFRAP